MALVRQRPNLNLHVQLPEEIDHEAPQLLPLPLVLPTTISTASHHIDTLSDFEKLQRLGYGIGGTVYKVCHKHTGAVYALKIIHGDARTSEHDQVREEIEILSSTNSPFIVGCQDVFQNSSGEVALLMEFMDGGSLDNLAKTNGTFSETIIANIAYQGLMGLDYLHKNKIVHRDIKPSNLLVNHEMQVKIADFGISKVISCGSEGSCNMHVGTCAYMSPERFDPETYGYDAFAGDIWSLGLTLMELYIGHHPYVQPGQRADGTALMWEICFDEPPSLPEDASEDFRDFIQCFLQKDWRKRWSASQLLSHPFVAGKRWNN